MLPGPRHRGSLPCGRYLLGNKEGSKGLMVLLVKPTPTRFLTDSLYTPMDNTPLHSIRSACHPWGGQLSSRIYIDDLINSTHVYFVLTTSSLNLISCISQNSETHQRRSNFSILRDRSLFLQRVPKNPTSTSTTTGLFHHLLLFLVFATAAVGSFAFYQKEKKFFPLTK